jgi:hypothetical protein
MDTNLILLIIAAIFALPGGLFFASIMTGPRARLLAIPGGIVGDLVVAAAIYLYLQRAHPSIDGLSYTLGCFFACSMGVFGAALLVNFFVGLTRRGPDLTSAEF